MRKIQPIYPTNISILLWLQQEEGSVLHRFAPPLISMFAQGGGLQSDLGCFLKLLTKTLYTVYGSSKYNNTIIQ